MSKFTDRLWRDLVREHGPDLAQLERPDPGRRRRAGRPVLAGTALGLGGLATAAVLLFGAASSTPAFAVTRNHDGTYTIQLRSLTAITAANRTLHGMQVPVRLVPVTFSCGVSLSSWAHATIPPALRTARQVAAQARVDPSKIPPGQTLAIPAWRVGHVVRVMPMSLSGTTTVACLPPPCGLEAPPPPGDFGSSGSPGSNSGNSGPNTTSPSPRQIIARRASVSRTALVPLPNTNVKVVGVPANLRYRLVRLARAVRAACGVRPGEGAP
jgi:hypothetical protein